MIRLALSERDQCDAVDLARVATALGENIIERLALAESLYRGPFLADWPFEEWAAQPRAGLEELFKQVVERLAAALVDAGRPREAIPRYRRLLLLEPEREGWHRDLMRAHAAAGERALALRQFHACRTLLRREQGVQPDAEESARSTPSCCARRTPPRACDARVTATGDAGAASVVRRSRRRTGGAMEFLNAVGSQRSIRWFRPWQPVEPERCNGFWRRPAWRPVRGTSSPGAPSSCARRSSTPGQAARGGQRPAAARAGPRVDLLVRRRVGHQPSGVPRPRSPSASR